MAKKKKLTNNDKAMMEAFGWDSSKDGGPWSKETQEILKHTSALALLLRDCDRESLEKARDRLQHFSDSWIRSGEGDVLPCSGKNADLDGALCDVDVIQLVIEAIDERIHS